MWRAVSIPSIPGMRTSSSTNSGSSSSTASSASSPEPALPTQRKPGVAATTSRATSRKTTWSSTPRTPTRLGERAHGDRMRRAPPRRHPIGVNSQAAGEVSRTPIGRHTPLCPGGRGWDAPRRGPGPDGTSAGPTRLLETVLRAPAELPSRSSRARPAPAPRTAAGRCAATCPSPCSSPRPATARRPCSASGRPATTPVRMGHPRPRGQRPAELLSSVALALDDDRAGRLGRARGSFVAGAREGATAALRRLTRSLARSERARVLVLDDLHVLDAQEARDVVTAIAHACGHGLQLALASRSDAVAPARQAACHTARLGRAARPASSP